jgi:hypothetical protein
VQFGQLLIEVVLRAVPPRRKSSLSFCPLGGRLLLLDK